MLQQANAAIERQHRQQAVDELRARVEDWKSHDISQFGDLLLHGAFTVVKGDGRNDVEREVRIKTAHSSSFKSVLSFSGAKAKLGNLPAALDFMNMHSDGDIRVSKSRHPKQDRNRSQPSTPGSGPDSRIPGSLPDTPRFSDESIARSIRAHSLGTGFSPADLRIPSSKRRTPPAPSGRGASRNASPRPTRRSDTSLSSCEEHTLESLMALEGFLDASQSVPVLDENIPLEKPNPPNKVKDKSRKPSFKRLLSALAPLRSEPGYVPPENAPDTPPDDNSLPFQLKFGPRVRCSQGSSEASSPSAYSITSQLRNVSSSDQQSDLTMSSSDRLRTHLQLAARATDGGTGAFTPYYHGGQSTTFLEKKPVQLESATILEENYADENGLRPVRFDQYTIYLFERILLCCKEQNPNKQKNKVMSMNKPAIDKKGKPRLQLKGRIFMQNVTETLSLQKPGSSMPFSGMTCW